MTNQNESHAGVAVRAELFGVENLDCRACRCVDFNLCPAGEVLPRVVDKHARHRLRTSAGWTHIHDANWFVRLSAQHSGRGVHHTRRIPRRTVEARLIPSCYFNSCVVSLAEVITVVADGAGDPLPSPFARVEECRLEPRRLRPRARADVRPCAGRPVVAFARLECGAGVDRPRVGGRHPSRVPDIGVVALLHWGFIPGRCSDSPRPRPLTRRDR